MGFLPQFLSVVTFGGYGRLGRAQSEYTTVHRAYRGLHKTVANERQRANSALAQLGQTTRDSLALLAKAQVVLSRLGGTKARAPSQLTANAADVDQPSLPGCLGAGSVLAQYKALAQGAGVGGAVAIGSWSLVSLLGTASTGTAISGLAGAAATDATLAWFGGGAIAAGGAGMVGGALALGGLALIPMIAVVTRLSHKKADKLQGEIEKLQAEMATLRHLQTTFTDLATSAGSQNERLVQEKAALREELANSQSKLFPWGLMSRLWRRLRSWLPGGRYYDDGDMRVLVQLNAAVSRFAALFDPSTPKGATA